MRDRRGYAIPLSLCVAGVTLFLGLSVAQLSTGDLRLATQQYYHERAYQAAEYGLQKQLRSNAGVYSLVTDSGANQDDRAEVVVFDNQAGANPRSFPGCPVEVPAGYQYWVSTGRACKGSQVLGEARLGALVHWGEALGGAGAQIESMTVHGASVGVNFSGIDGLTGQAAPNESLVSSSAVGASQINLGTVLGFEGKVRLPAGAPNTVVQSTGASVPTVMDGGQVNLPEFNPPLGGVYQSTFTAPAGNSVLPPGHYGSLTLQAGSHLQMDGKYYIENLILPGPADVSLETASGDTALVYVDRMTAAGGALGLDNQNGSARNFRLYFKPAPPAAASPPLPFKMIQGGKVAVSAPGYSLQLQADASGLVRGAFAARDLSLDYPGATGSFVYDVSASSSRASDPVTPNPNGAGDGGVTQGHPLPQPQPGPNGTDPGIPSRPQDSSDGRSGNAGNSGNGRNTRSRPQPQPQPQPQPPEVVEEVVPNSSPAYEPMILSRQAL